MIVRLKTLSSILTTAISGSKRIRFSAKTAEKVIASAPDTSPITPAILSKSTIDLDIQAMIDMPSTKRAAGTSSLRSLLLNTMVLETANSR